MLPMRRRKLLRRSSSAMIPQVAAIVDNLASPNVSASTSKGVYCEVSLAIVKDPVASRWKGDLGSANVRTQLLTKSVLQEILNQKETDNVGP